MISVENLLAVGAVLGAVAVIGGAVLAVFKGCRWMWRLGRRTGHFLDDWNGEAPRDGEVGRPGALARLGAVEKELKPNGGSTLKDAVSRLEANLTTVVEQSIANGAGIDTMTEAVSTLDQRVQALEAGRGVWRSGRISRKT